MMDLIIEVIQMIELCLVTNTMIGEYLDMPFSKCLSLNNYTLFLTCLKLSESFVFLSRGASIIYIYYSWFDQPNLLFRNLSVKRTSSDRAIHIVKH